MHGGETIVQYTLYAIVCECVLLHDPPSLRLLPGFRPSCGRDSGCTGLRRTPSPPSLGHQYPSPSPSLASQTIAIIYHLFYYCSIISPSKMGLACEMGSPDNTCTTKYLFGRVAIMLWHGNTSLWYTYSLTSPSPSILTLSVISGSFFPVMGLMSLR